jgi:hypothetical protein
MNDQDIPKLDVFVTHTLHGARAEQHSMPVEVLADLAVYKEIVVAVARALFFSRNPGRQRVPRGFEDGFQLVLRQAIGHGSAVAVLERPVTPAAGAQASLFATTELDYFAAGRDLVAEAISAVAMGRPLPAEFPRTVLPSFNSFGRNLRPDERLEIRSPRLTTGASYDRNVRKQMVLQRATTYEDHAEFVAAVAMFDGVRMTFELLVDGRRVPGKLPDLSSDAAPIIRTAAGYGEELRVRVVGLGSYDANDRLTALLRVDEASFAEDEGKRAQLDIEARLNKLAELPSGWLDGSGTSFDRDGLIWLTGALKSAETSGLPRPYLYPMLDGRVQAEWEWTLPEARSVSAEIDLQGHTASLLGVYQRTGAAAESSLNLDEGGLEKLVAFVLSFDPRSPGLRS